MENKIKFSKKIKYLYNHFERTHYNSINQVPIDNEKISYSIDKKKRWDPEEWDKPLISIKSFSGKEIISTNLNSGKKEINIPHKWDRNNKNKYFYNEKTNPKPDWIYNKISSFSGCHCLRITKEKRDIKRRLHKKEKKDSLTLQNNIM